MIISFLSILFWLIGAFAIVSGLSNEDMILLALGTLLWVGSNFFEILINRVRYKQLEEEFTKFVTKYNKNTKGRKPRKT